MASHKVHQVVGFSFCVNGPTHNAGVPAETPTSLADVLDDPQLAARGFFVPITHPAAGTYKYPLHPTQFSGTPALDYRPAPLYGQHNLDVLQDILGLTADEMADLEKAEVIGWEPQEDEVRLRKH